MEAVEERRENRLREYDLRCQTGGKSGMNILNWKLISHPMNWVIIMLMLIIAGIFGHLILSVLDQEPASVTQVPAGLPAGYSPNA